MTGGWEACAAACDRVFAALDWRALGDVYFHEDGERDLRERRGALLGLGEQLARALLRRVPPGGSSLWVGAGLVELPVLIAERLVAGREVVAANLRAEECALLDAGLRRADVGIELVAGDARAAGGARTFDHLGCVSVFTDPETWPLCSGVGYGRIAPVQLDVEAFAAERDRARGVARELFARLLRPGWITTSAEEAPWFLDAAAAAGVGYEADDELLETALVGDPVGFLRIG